MNYSYNFIRQLAGFFCPKESGGGIIHKGCPNPDLYTSGAYARFYKVHLNKTKENIIPKYALNTLFSTNNTIFDKDYIFTFSVKSDYGNTYLVHSVKNSIEILEEGYGYNSIKTSTVKKVSYKNDQYYYVGNGMVFYDNMELLCSVAYGINYRDDVDESKKEGEGAVPKYLRFYLSKVYLYVNPKVFLKDDVFSKFVLRKIIPYVVKNGIRWDLYDSSFYGLVPQEEKVNNNDYLKVHIVLDNIKMFDEVEAPGSLSYVTDDVKRKYILKQCKEIVLNNLTEFIH